MKLLGKKLKSKKGQAIVEFALALPLILTILCGILDFGWIYSNQYKIQYAAYTGARCASLIAENTSQQEVISTVKAKVAENLYDKNENHVTVTISSASREVTVRVDYPIRTLTFVASTVFGRYYNATVSDVATY